MKDSELSNAPFDPDASGSGSDRSLRAVLALVLIGGVALAVGVDIVLLRQVGMLRRQSEELERFVVDYERNELPVIERFVTDLQGFARTNADFRPILGRHIVSEDAPKLNPPPSPPRGL